MQIKIEHETQIFTWKTLAGKNHGRQPAIFTIWREFTERREYNESSALPVRLTRCIYRTDWLQSNTETNPLINMTEPWALQASPQDQRY